MGNNNKKSFPIGKNFLRTLRHSHASLRTNPRGAKFKLHRAPKTRRNFSNIHKHTFSLKKKLNENNKIKIDPILLFYFIKFTTHIVKPIRYNK